MSPMNQSSLTHSNGWISETDDGMKHWPILSIVDIVDFFMEQNTETDDVWVTADKK